MRADHRSLRDRRFPPRLFPLLVILILVAQSVTAQARTYRVEEGLAYSSSGGQEQLLDIAWPANGAGPFPLIIFLPGNAWGWWQYESRTTYFAEIRKAAKRGYAAAAVDCRASRAGEDGRPGSRFPAQLQDVKAAIRWLRSHAGSYAIDPARVAVVGFSSGAHLALLAAFTDPRDGLEGDGADPAVSSAVRAAVCVAAPVDLALQYRESGTPHEVFVEFVGATPQESPELYRRVFPLTYLGAGDPPVLIIQGDQDAYVPLSQALLLDQRMTEAGVPHELIVRKGGKHENLPLDDVIWRFLDEHLR